MCNLPCSEGDESGNDDDYDSGDDGDIDDDDVDDDDDGLPAYSHHDKIPPWWVFVRDDYGGNLSVTKSHH